MKTSFDKDASDIETHLKNMRPKSLNQKEKQAMWSKILSAISAEPYAGRVMLRGWLGKRGKGLRLIAGAMVVILLGGTAAFAAADNSGPGDFLYPLDIASEKIVIAFASKDKKAELKVKYSEERLEEARKIVTQIVIKETVLVNTSGASASATTTTSVNAGTSTPPSGTSTPPASTPDSRGLERAKEALTQALARLEATKKDLEASGNINAALAVGRTIEKLTDLASNHLEDLEKVKLKIRNDDKKLKIELSASTDDIKTKFKLEEKKGKKSERKIELDDDDDDDGHISTSTPPGNNTATSSPRGDDKDDEGDDEKEERHSDDKRKEKKDKDDDEDDKDKDDDEDDDDRDRNGNGNKKVVICHVSGRGRASTTINVSESALRAHLAHGDKLGVCLPPVVPPVVPPVLPPPPPPPPPPDITAPVISQIVALNIGSTTSSIGWTTNESATGKVYYGTSSPLNLPSVTSVINTSLTLNHSFNLAGLAASSTHYFVVESKDAANNTATSSENTFITLP